MHNSSDGKFWIGVIFSVFLHGGTFGYLVVSAGPVESRPKIKVEAMTAVLVRKGKPIPKNKLPEIIRERTSKVRRKKIVKEKPKVKSNRKKKKRERKKKRQENDKKAMERSQRILKEYMKKAHQEEDKRAFKGTLPGVASGSKYGTVSDPALARKGLLYGAKVRQRIDRSLKFPDTFTDRQIFRYKKRIVIELIITKSGALKKAKILKSSGSRGFNSIVLNAVRRAAPYPPPPRKIWKLIKDGIDIGW